MTTENDRRRALGRSHRMNPGSQTYRKADEPSKKDLQDMLREAVLNTSISAPSKDLEIT